MAVNVVIHALYPGGAPMARQPVTVTAMTGPAGAALADLSVVGGTRGVALSASGTATVALDQTTVAGDPIVWRITVGRLVRHLDLSDVADDATVQWGDPAVLVLEGPAPSDWVPVQGDPGVVAATGLATYDAETQTIDVTASASEVTYDPSSSGLTADTVQEAIDEIAAGGGAVDSVNGETGVVVLDAGDVGAVPTSRTVNGNALSTDVTLDASDVGAVPIDAVGLAAGERNMGAWDAATSYAVGDVVFSGGALYAALAPSLNDSPPSAAWDDISARPGLVVALGAGASAGEGSVAAGVGASAAGDYSVAAGAGASAAGEGSVAVGAGASAAGEGAVNLAHVITGHVTDPLGTPTPDGLTLATGFADLPETASVTNPAADHWRLVARTDGIYVRNESGTEVGPLGAGGGCPFTPGRTYATTSVNPTGYSFHSHEVTFVPWPVGRAGVVISTMGVVVHTALAGGKVHLGIYSSVDGLPANLIGTLGYVTTDSTGYVSIAGSLPIPSGLVWLAIKPFGGSTMLLGNANARMNEYVPSNTTSPYHQYTMTVCRTSHAADSLPATVTPGWVSVWNILPMIHVGASA